MKRITLLPLLLLGGCFLPLEFPDPVGDYNASLYTWIGAPVGEAIAMWGEPHSIQPFTGDRQTYTWLRFSASHMSPVTCTTTLIVNAEGRIGNFDPAGMNEGCTRLVPPPARPR